MILKNVGIICYWETGLAFKTNFFIQQIWSSFFRSTSRQLFGVQTTKF